jgi:hypothetical protein
MIMEVVSLLQKAKSGVDSGESAVRIFYFIAAPDGSNLRKRMPVHSQVLKTNGADGDPDEQKSGYTKPNFAVQVDATIESSNKINPVCAFTAPLTPARAGPSFLRAKGPLAMWVELERAGPFALRSAWPACSASRALRAACGGACGFRRPAQPPAGAQLTLGLAPLTERI